MFAVSLLNGMLTFALLAALIIGIVHAGVLLEVRSPYARAAVCWLDVFFYGNFGAYGKFLRPANAANFCW